MKRLSVLVILPFLLTGCSGSAPAQSLEPNQIDYAFTQSGQHPELLLIRVIDSAKSNLDIAIYSLTHPDIVAAIERAKKRGVAVRIITDQEQAKGKTQSEALRELRKVGIPIKKNTHSGLMHLKVAVADQSTFTFGSFNDTKQAATYNDEVLAAIKNEKLAKEWDQEFEKMWSDHSKFQDLK
jgi:phosphatidylserine/phosphatidylglycerophosphate/cardiolipin synthase-like enzyme